MGFRKVVLCALLLSLLASISQTPLALASEITWPAWDNKTPYPHTIFGVPKYNKNDPCHNIVREYGAFTIYYDDEVLSPRWTAIKVTYLMVDKNNDINRLSGFRMDKELKRKGYKVTVDADYNNPTGLRKWTRGHMVQFDDARGYGKQAAEDSFYTSNVCPQLSALNGRGWLTLEETCAEFARYYKVVWIYTGPIYDKAKKPFAKDRKVPAPIAFYKIVASPGDGNSVDVLAFRMPHKLIPRKVDVSKYLVSVRDIEQETGLDFFHELPDDLENEIETTVWELWPDMPN